MIWKKSKYKKNQIKKISKNIKIKEHIVEKPKKQKINVKIDEKVGEGIYANFFMIVNNPSEFIIDCGRMLPGLPTARIYSRILTTPQHAKQLLKTLEQNIEKFEDQFGEIKLPGIHEEKEIGFKSTGQNS